MELVSTEIYTVIVRTYYIDIYTVEIIIFNQLDVDVVSFYIQICS